MVSQPLDQDSIWNGNVEPSITLKERRWSTLVLTTVKRSLKQVSLEG
jgi:hypothetical protein